MARLPDVDSLGARPVPVSNRRISSVRNAGAVADAVGQFGDQMAKTGNEMLEKQDRLAYAAAKSAYLKADVAARNELADDPEYGTYETRYTEKMKAAQETAAGFIKSKSDRALFTADIGVDFERGRGEILKAARGKEVVAKKAVSIQSRENFRDVHANALDEATRTSAIMGINESINADLRAGLIDPVEAVSLREQFGSELAGSYGQSLIDQERFEEAASYIEANKNIISRSVGIGLQRQLKGGMDVRIAAEDFAVASYLPDVETKPDAVATTSSGPVGNGKQIVESLIPGVVVTSSYRGPDHALSKKNPNSWHAKSHAAVDVKPVAGMSFQQYVKSFEDQGYKILEALDETGSGKSKHATGDHWHIVLGAKGAAAVSNAPRRWDKAQVYDKIEQAASQEGWTPERTERAKAYADKEIARDEQLLNREYSEADRAASDVVIGLGDDFKSINQIPSNIRDKMDSRDLAKYINAAERNAAPKEVPANGATALSLNLMRVSDPDGFAKLSIGQFAGELTRAELETLAVQQATIRTAKPGAFNPRTGITSAISWGSKYGGVKLEDADFVPVYDIMETELRQRYEATGKPPTEAEYEAAFRSATRGVKTTNKGVFWGMGPDSASEKPRYALGADNIPAKDLAKVRARAEIVYGKNPTDEQISKAYRLGKGRYW